MISFFQFIHWYFMLSIIMFSLLQNKSKINNESKEMKKEAVRINEEILKNQIGFGRKNNNENKEMKIPMKNSSQHKQVILFN